MTQFQYRMWLGCSIISSLLALGSLAFSVYNRHLESVLAVQQAELNQFQSEIQRGAVSRRVTLNIFQDLSPLAASRPEVQALFTRYGVTLNRPPSSNP